MDIRTPALAALAAGCLIGGAAGAYLVGGARQTGAPAIGDTATDVTAAGPQTATPDQPASDPARYAAPVASAPVRRATPVQPAREHVDTIEPPRSPSGATTGVDMAPAGDVVESRALAPIEPAPVETFGAPEPLFTELTIPAESVLGLEVETSLTSERAAVEDEVVARLTRDVRSGERVAIPAGSRARGEVTLVERGGRLRERARLAVRFTSLVLPDGTRVPIDTDPLIREGDAPAGRSTATIGGGAIGGAIIGGILGGTRGAVIGGSVGAGAGTAAALAGGRSAATLPSGTLVTVRLTKPAYVTLEH
ncbi:MAG: hypothetical protein A3H29_05180 [Acidobacteria bacterium RIFCSPLOWO2_02_FULL_67_21]|nr:MAG: hypothetical protein A3H29_05180 [Acidobacteria bacterium RIFCSPLOWO2_02_FULL_67_21]